MLVHRTINHSVSMNIGGRRLYRMNARTILLFAVGVAVVAFSGCPARQGSALPGLAGNCDIIYNDEIKIV